MNYIEEHIEGKYFIRVKITKPMFGIVIDFPANLIFDEPEENRVYSIEEDRVKIYSSGVLVEEYKCPLYASRLSIYSDIVRITESRELSPELLVGFENGQRFEVKKSLKECIYVNFTEKELALEEKLEKYSSSVNKSSGPPDKDIEDGYSVMLSRYLIGD